MSGCAFVKKVASCSIEEMRGKNPIARGCQKLAKVDVSIDVDEVEEVKKMSSLMFPMPKMGEDARTYRGSAVGMPERVGNRTAE